MYAIKWKAVCKTGCITQLLIYYFPQQTCVSLRNVINTVYVSFKSYINKEGVPTILPRIQADFVTVLIGKRYRSISQSLRESAIPTKYKFT
jgi:hypothetical protein